VAAAISPTVIDGELRPDFSAMLAFWSLFQGGDDKFSMVGEIKGRWTG
jgi:hypothetical protein